VSSTPSQPEPSTPDEVSATPQGAATRADDPHDAPVVIPAEGPLTDEQIAAIAATAQPATIRRAPRYRAFFWTGALLGIVLGVALGLWVSSENLVNRWIYVLVTTLGTTLVTVLLAGACAVWVDRRGAAKVAKQRRGSAGA
jgi:hypothetical protein